MGLAAIYAQHDPHSHVTQIQMPTHSDASPIQLSNMSQGIGQPVVGHRAKGQRWSG